MTEEHWLELWNRSPDVQDVLDRIKRTGEYFVVEHVNGTIAYFEYRKNRDEVVARTPEMEHPDPSKFLDIALDDRATKWRWQEEAP